MDLKPEEGDHVKFVSQDLQHLKQPTWLYQEW
jgi:hypothetical protein